MPVGAALISEEVAATISFGDHGSTYGGNLLACRAALCFLDELVGGGLLSHIGRVGRFFEQRLRAMAAKHAIVKEVRGAGLIWGLELTRDAAPVVPAALERGVIVNRTAERSSDCCRRWSSPKPKPTRRSVGSSGARRDRPGWRTTG